MERRYNNTYPTREAFLDALDKGQLEFTNENFAELDLSGIEMPQETTLAFCNLSGADLRKIIAPQIILRGSNLNEAKVTQANFTDGNLYQCIANRVDFSTTNLSGADITGIKINKTLFEPQVLPWLPAAIEYGVRLPRYTPQYMQD